ncbi:MAG: methyltransferase domain-containing protein [Bryobacterales bacterium]|nr:methyltransferase domain-containing protein [Bryobacterales bacterium]
MNPAEFANIAATEEHFWWFQGMNRMLCDFLDRHHSSGGLMLEVGCGTGGVSTLFERRYPASNVVSMDLAPEGLRYARDRGLRRLALADMRSLPFARNCVQTLLALDVLVHLEPGEERTALDEFVRVLAPGGLLLLRVSAFPWLRSRHSAFVNERQRFRKQDLLPALERSGLTPIRHTYANCLLLPVSLFKFRVWEPLMNAPPESGLRPLPPLFNAALRSILTAEAAWLRHGGSFPVGQSLWVLARKRSIPA